MNNIFVKKNENHNKSLMDKFIDMTMDFKKLDEVKLFLDEFNKKYKDITGFNVELNFNVIEPTAPVEIIEDLNNSVEAVEDIENSNNSVEPVEDTIKKKTFHCKVCEKYFKDNYALQRHRKTKKCSLKQLEYTNRPFN